MSNEQIRSGEAVSETELLPPAGFAQQWISRGDFASFSAACDNDQAIAFSKLLDHPELIDDVGIVFAIGDRLDFASARSGAQSLLGDGVDDEIAWLKNAV